MLMKALVLFEIDLKRVLNEKLTSEVRVSYLNTLKILTYLVVEFTNHMEKKQQSSKENDFLSTGSKVVQNHHKIILTCLFSTDIMSTNTTTKKSAFKR